MNENELYHHGVIGMKWGVRRYQNKDGSLTSAGKKRQSKTASVKGKPKVKNAKKTKDASLNEKEKAIRKKDLKNRRTLSDADLKKRIDRMKMEKEFKNLTEEDISPGKKVTKEILSSAGTKVLTAAAAGAMAYAVKTAMTKKFDMTEAASYIAANPNKKK